MKRGRPSTGAGKPARRVRPDSQKADAAAVLNESDPDAAAQAQASGLNSKGRPRRSRSTKQPRQTPKRALLAAILADIISPAVKDGPPAAELLNESDRRAVRQAHVDGVTANDVAALVVYSVRVAHRLYERGELAGKDLVVAMNKATAHAAAAAQLASTQAAKDVPPAMEITFSMENLPTAVGMPNRDVVQRPDQGPLGDRIDVEQG